MKEVKSITFEYIRGSVQTAAPSFGKRRPSVPIRGLNLLFQVNKKSTKVILFVSYSVDEQVFLGGRDSPTRAGATLTSVAASNDSNVAAINIWD